MTDNRDESEKDEPIIRDKRRIDPETGDVREPQAGASDDAPVEGEELSPEDQALLDEASKDLVADMRNDMLRAQAELVNFRQRVERDRAANREAVIAEVLRSLLPVIDDLALAEAHGDLVEGAPVTLIAQKLRATFEKYGLKEVGVKGEPFDPTIHEAVVQLPDPAATSQTVADVIQAGYILGDRLVRPAKVAVSVPAE
ncbi:nucleotide exchange factor GrpE [Leifsonia sp. H3M29-4]|uniref:nucleotide exchange factor GrpE n=1 Tax=Salinibacterium metalliresistens TaxID=3031321 RepID=UPI0023DAFFB0|nr:nucleotide exchange factor GrpE [Salinibacterium metalliresistens]MDF1477632.1 nucleotide exchange factor GrpE [Salinibacterium metalliresistens]